MPVTFDPGQVQRNRSMRPLTTLKAGGTAESLFVARTADELAETAEYAQTHDWPTTVIGAGSNVLPSDRGVPGLVVVNRTTSLTVEADGLVTADTGCSFQELFLKTAQASLAGLEFAVGIPGSVGGALVSNAGAYRSNISEFLTDIEVVFEGRRRWVEPAFLQFSYRDSLLRRPSPPPCTLVQIRLRLPKGDAWAIYKEATDYQRQRISKQPPPASAGSFFKNVEDRGFAESLPQLGEKLKAAGVVPAGFLIEQAGLRGVRHGGAMIARRHANFIVNVRSATATEIRQLAGLVKRRVFERFGVMLEEEVLYLGDWSGYQEVWG
ncbi:MAG: UDP-N-acetylmuramate dehydrogenase [Armatimonadetes bacterium]|nr:UDP-N-acetylmuramate dehydrogenase [Armatimonadota bacterium]